MSGSAQGPHPVGLYWIVGTLKLAIGGDDEKCGGKNLFLNYKTKELILILSQDLGERGIFQIEEIETKATIASKETNASEETITHIRVETQKIDFVTRIKETMSGTRSERDGAQQHRDREASA